MAFHFISLTRGMRPLGALVPLMLGVGAGCADPCAELERRVCERQEDRSRCEWMQDSDRRERLSNAACESILKVVPAP
jgi:hypothetical protein